MACICVARLPLFLHGCKQYNYIVLTDWYVGWEPVPLLHFFWHSKISDTCYMWQSSPRRNQQMTYSPSICVLGRPLCSSWCMCLTKTAKHHPFGRSCLLLRQQKIETRRRSHAWRDICFCALLERKVKAKMAIASLRNCLPTWSDTCKKRQSSILF